MFAVELTIQIDDICVRVGNQTYFLTLWLLLSFVDVQKHKNESVRTFFSSVIHSQNVNIYYLTAELPE